MDPFPPFLLQVSKSMNFFAMIFFSLQQLAEYLFPLLQLLSLFSPLSLQLSLLPQLFDDFVIHLNLLLQLLDLLIVQPQFSAVSPLQNFVFSPEFFFLLPQSFPF